MGKLNTMKKLLIILLLPLFSLGQELNKTNDGYTEVVDIELSKKEIYQKVNEWVALNYNSAKDVIQLNTEDKVIVKGNFLVNFSVGNLVASYRIHNTLTFSIRDNKYKIDLIPNRASSDTVGDIDSSLFNQFISLDTMTKEDYLKYSSEIVKESYLKLGYSEKKADKWVEKYVVSTVDDSYNLYMANKTVWDDNIASTFKNIKESISSSNTDDDW